MIASKPTHVVRLVPGETFVTVESQDVSSNHRPQHSYIEVEEPVDTAAVPGDTTLTLQRSVSAKELLTAQVHPTQSKKVCVWW